MTTGGDAGSESGERTRSSSTHQTDFLYNFFSYCLSYGVILIIGIELTVVSVSGFNLDTTRIISHRGPSGSMFGFSVAQHRDSNVSWILVGAPEADSRQPGVRRAGAVFRCSCEASDTCQMVPFDRTGNNLVQNLQIDEKSNQWFGATVKSSGDDGIILACAPRYTWFTSNRKRRDPVGTCYTAKDSFTEFVEYSPCRTTKWGYHRQGSCQIGLGADVDPAGRRIFLGAVGSWYWQGQMFMVDSRKAASGGSRAPFYQFVPPGQLFSQSSTLRPDIRWTREGPSSDDDSYLGYSVASGEFSGDSDADVAVGMPRGANLTGKVVVYSSELRNLHNITGEQIGAYFGYSLCVLDVDGDGLDDIVVGTPMYTDYQDTAMKIETGRVYVVYQNKKHKFKRWDSMDGTAHRGRFGLSLTSLGDINRDGIDDFAVGAPYDGLYGRGAVYIFQGTQEGVRKEPTQVIHGSNLQHSVNTFGFSLSGQRDLDGNGYPDLLVGAYESDVVALFRSRPVVRVRSKLTFTSGKQINLDERKCTLRDGKTRVACFPLSLCMSYDGFGADEVIDFNVEYLLDSKKTKEHRMFFLNNEGIHSLNNTVRLQKTVEQCSNTQVYIRPQIRDKLTSLEAELKYSMIETRSRHLAPVIDVTGSTVDRDSVSIRKDCGPDNVCVPDLRLRVSQSDEAFIMGSTERIWIEIQVENNGEDSFESMLYIKVPAGLSYVTADPLDTRKDIPILCSAPTPSTNNTVRCDVGNPLPTFAKARVRIYFQTRETSDPKRSFEFTVRVNSTNPEDGYRTGDNYREIVMPIEVATDLKVFGSSKPQPLPYNVTFYQGKAKLNESHIGPEVLHTYEVKCIGPSNIEEASVTIFWPSFTLDGEHFLYLLEPPTTDGPATCEPIDTVNPLGIKIQKHTKYISHTSTTTVQEGEGRRRNFTHSSEYITDGGSYTQTYRNSSVETRRSHVSSGGSNFGISEESSFGTSGIRGGSSTTLLAGSGGQRGSGVTTSGNNFRTDETSYRRGGSTNLSSGRGSISSNSRGGSRNYDTGREVITTFDSSRGVDGNFDGRGGHVGFDGDFVTDETRYRDGGKSSVGSFVPKYGERGYTGGERERTYTSNYGNGRSSSGRPTNNFYGRTNFDWDRGRGNSYREDRRTFTPTSEGREGPQYGGRGYVSRTESWREASSTSNGRGGYDGTSNGRRRGGEGDYVSFEHGSEEKFLDRHKRSETEGVVQCGNAQCTVIRCRIGPLTSDSSVTFYLRGRVYADTLQAKYAGESVELASKLVTKVTQLPSNVSPDFMMAKELSLVTTVQEEIDLSVPPPIPWWVYLIAIIAGILFLLLLIFLLYMCGFFMRRRPNSSPEGQPLHRNGYQERM